MADEFPSGITPFARANFDDRVKLAEASFKTILDADLHEDDKAGRILSAMAFLTTAAAVIFNVAYNPGPSTTTLKQTLTQTLLAYVSRAQISSAVNSVAESLQKPSLAIFGLSISVLAFSAYIFFVLVGAVLYLGALGPSLNKPTKLKEEVPSLLFFHSIAPLENEKWSDHWKDNSMKELQDQMVLNYIKECQLVAQKVNAKVTLMSWGSIFFRVAILFFVVLMAALFSPDIGAVLLVLLLGLSGLFFSFTFVSRTLPRQKLQQPRWQTVISTITTLLYLKRKSDIKNQPWQSVFFVRLAELSLIGFVVLLVIKLISR